MSRGRRAVLRLRRVFDELRRRRVIRVGLAYLVVTFAVLEGVDMVFSALLLPDWTFRLLVVGSIFFFPVVLVLAWVYDITPEGVRRTDDEDPSGNPGTGDAGRGERAAGFPAAGPGGGRAPSAVAAPDAPSGLAAVATAADPIDSLAILPFAHREGDPEDEYLSDGITESIINKMASLEGIRVVPRASAFRYKNRPLDTAEVRQELRVRALVTGRIQQVGQMLVAQAELVDLRTDAQLWGDHYNRPMADIFTLQEEMAEEIVRSLQLRLTGTQKAKLMHRETESTRAYQAYLRGRHCWNKRTADGFRRAIRHFQEAIDLDPEYALAYAGMADTYNVLGYYNIEPPREAYPRAMAAARRVLEIDDEVAEAHASLGYATLFYEREYEQAARELERAIELDPTYATAHQWYGWYLLVRERFDEMVASLEKAVELDPLSLIINDHYGYALFLAGRYDEAERQIRRTLDLDPNYPLAYQRLGNLHQHRDEQEPAIEALRRSCELSDGMLARGYLGQALALAGREDEARALLDELEAGPEDREGHYVSPLDRALVQSGLGEVDATVAALEEAVEERVSDVVRLRLLPWPVEVREHPDFQAVLRELGLAR